VTPDELLLWGFGLLGAAVAIAFIEIFVPSAGVISIIAMLVAVAAIIAFWRVSWVWGVTSLMGTIIGGIGLFNLAIRVFPHTPMGKGLILGGAESEEELLRRARESAAADRTAQALLGATGTAMTDLRPVGMADIAGNRMEVLAEGGIIERGQSVRVTSVDDGQVRVRPLRA
jgi:membrane-bound ClpP family serine protease